MFEALSGRPNLHAMKWKYSWRTKGRQAIFWRDKGSLVSRVSLQVHTYTRGYKLQGLCPPACRLPSRQSIYRRKWAQSVSFGLIRPESIQCVFCCIFWISLCQAVIITCCEHLPRLWLILKRPTLRKKRIMCSVSKLDFCSSISPCGRRFDNIRTNCAHLIPSCNFFLFLRNFPFTIWLPQLYSCIESHTKSTTPSWPKAFVLTHKIKRNWFVWRPFWEHNGQKQGYTTSRFIRTGWVHYCVGVCLTRRDANWPNCATRTKRRAKSLAVGVRNTCKSPPFRSLHWRTESQLSCVCANNNFESEFAGECRLRMQAKGGEKMT